MAKPEGNAKRTRQRKEPALPEGVMTTTQAVKELGVSPATLRRWVKERRLEAAKVGKQWRFRQADLRRMVTLAPAPAEETRPTDATLRHEAQSALARLEGAAPKGEATPDRGSLPSGLRQARPVEALAGRILHVAVAHGASDLHFEPFPERLSVRYRVDGVLRELTALPRTLYPAVAAQIKQWAGLNPEEKTRPQDGRTIMSVSGRPVDFRLSAMPGVHGEVIAIRILDRDVQLPGLDRVGFEPDQLARWRRLIHGPQGLLLVCGPAGCGKTTVAYASLAELSGPEVKILTVEDPVEYLLPGVSQTQLRAEVGYDFLAAVRAMMRQAANVMFIGELRDRACAEAVCAAALSGHLVFSQMHTRDAPLTLRRLAEMGVPLHSLAGAIVGITNQRLVRRLCPACRQEYRPSLRDFEALAVPPEYRDARFHIGKGCDQCHQHGYRGRVAVIELLELTGPVREAVSRNDLGAGLLKAARAADWCPMREIVLGKILRGETTIEAAIHAGLGASDGTPP